MNIGDVSQSVLGVPNESQVPEAARWGHDASVCEGRVLNRLTLVNLRPREEANSLRPL
jgi:hypothetical protein